MKTKIKTQKRSILGIFKVSLKSVNFAVYALLVLAGGYYVVCANSLSVKGYELNDLKSRARDLKAENAENELKAMALESYQNIKERAKAMKLVKAEKIEYLDGSTGAVAKK